MCIYIIIYILSMPFIQESIEIHSLWIPKDWKFKKSLDASRSFHRHMLEQITHRACFACANSDSALAQHCRGSIDTKLTILSASFSSIPLIASRSQQAPPTLPPPPFDLEAGLEAGGAFEWAQVCASSQPLGWEHTTSWWVLELLDWQLASSQVLQGHVGNPQLNPVLPVQTHVRSPEAPGQHSGCLAAAMLWSWQK